MKTALLLIAHGSRNADANNDLLVLAEELRLQGTYEIVEASYLELAEPGIEAGGCRCVSLGAERVILSPYFLSAGVHVRRDLQNHRAVLAAKFPGVTWLLAEPLGRHPALTSIVVQRAREAQASQ